MTNPLEVYDAVDLFLKERGYHAFLRRKEGDGHALRQSIAELKTSACVCNPNGCCGDIAIRNLLEAMRQIGGWHGSDVAEQLRAAGHPVYENV